MSYIDKSHKCNLHWWLKSYRPPKQFQYSNQSPQVPNHARHDSTKHQHNDKEDIEPRTPKLIINHSRNNSS